MKSGFAAVGVVVLLVGCGTGPGMQMAQPAAPARPDLQALYTQSIYQSAVKRPSYQVKLLPIDTSKSSVTVISLSQGPVVDGNGRVTNATWISQPSELLPHCAGQPDSVLALEQTLGMPPVANDPAKPWQLVQFSVSPKDMFRPCASGGDISTAQCSFDLPTRFASPADEAAYREVQGFVFAQMWTSYIDGFPSGPGYPFTGMGWTYDWSPQSTTHVGISEYLVRKGSLAYSVTRVTPQQFCRGS